MDMKQLDSLFSSFSRGCNDEVYANFVKVLFELIDRLILIFRKYDTPLRKARNDLALAVGNGNSKEVVGVVMGVLDPLKELVLERNPLAISKLNGLHFLKDLDLASDWPQLSERTQTVFFQYLGKLITLGCKCHEAEKVLAPLQNDEFRQKLMKATIECEAEFSSGGREVSSMDDIMAIADKINKRIV